MFLTNYWALKYSQQVKQYSTDLLVSSLFLLLLTSYSVDGHKRSTFWALVFGGGLSVFLSYTAVFWFPVCLLLVAFAAWDHAYPEDGTRSKGNPLSKFTDCITTLLAYAGCFGVANWVFIRPNRSASLVQFWIGDFIGSGGLLRSLAHFFQSICDLMLPQQFEWSHVFSYACGVVIILASLRAIVAQYRGDKRARSFVALAILPVITAVIASYFRQYPLLTKPRMIIWLLPICTLMFVYAIEPLWTWLAAKAGTRTSLLLTATTTVLICMFAMGLSFFVVERGRSNPLDDFRSGVQYLSRNGDPNDPVFVYALGAEELGYYTQRLHWHPKSVFVGNTNLGCCLPGAPVVVGDNSRRLGLAQDVHSFVKGANAERIWFLLQSGNHQQLIVDHARSESSAAGCRNATTFRFESTLLLGFDCASSAAQSRLK